MIALFFVLVTATFHPTEPTVGDPITIEFTAPMTVQPSPDYEIVSRSPTRGVVRTFEPRPIAVHTSDGDIVIPIKSVLAPDDSLKPAPLQPPRPLPASRTPWIAIAIAALCAALTWLAVLLRRATRAVVSAPVIPADVRFRDAVRDATRTPRRWAALADATREYLAAAYGIGVELTTAEVLARSGELEPSLQAILRQGDLEKFSPWGAQPADFDAAAASALNLIVPPPIVQQEAA